MKRISAFFTVFIMAIACTVLFAKPPQMGGGKHMHHMQIPPASGEMLHIANEVVSAINHQNAAELNKLLAPDAVYLDEDGRAPPARAWVHKLTMGKEHMTISSTHSQMWGDAGWVSFDYTLKQDYKGKPLTLLGTADFVCRNENGKWQIQMVHGALKQTVAAFAK